MKYLAMNRSARAALAAILFAGLAPAAQAGDDPELEIWKERASTRIGQAMTYPRLLGRRDLPAGHNIVEAKVDRSGRILSASLVESSGRSEFDRASIDFTERLTRLPALPESIRGEKVKVRMHLIYADNERELKNYMGTIVRTRQLAAANKTMAANDEDTVFDLFGGTR